MKSKLNLSIIFGLLACLSAAPCLAAQNSSMAGEKNQTKTMSSKDAVAACKKEGLVGKKLNDCVKEKTTGTK